MVYHLAALRDVTLSRFDAILINYDANYPISDNTLTLDGVKSFLTGNKHSSSLTSEKDQH